jgi:predicted dehydrogenase
LERKLRIAIAGAGFGEQYLTGLKAIPEVEVVGIYSRRAERAEEVAERFEIPYSTRHFHVLLELPRLDAVAVVTPNSTHAEFVRAALQARKHVICDKPLALAAAEGEDLYRLAERMAVKHVTFVPYRFSPAAMAMKQAMAEGQLGRVLKARASWGVDLRSEPLRWRFQSKLSGPGVATDLGAHILDLVTWWVAPIRRVLGHCRTLVPERPAEVGGRPRPVDVPDECWSLLEFAGAGVGSVSLSWNEKRDQKIEIEGERGTLIYQSPSMLQFLSGRGPFQPTSTLVRPGEEGRRVQLPMPNVQDFATPEAALAHMFRQIVSYLRGEEKPESVATFRDGAEVLKVIDAMVASNETGRWLEVERASEGGTVGLARLS